MKRAQRPVRPSRATTTALVGGTSQPIQISQEQARNHRLFEGLALLIAAPFSFWLAARPELPPNARALSFVIGAFTVAVDGALFLKYHAELNR